MAEKQKHLRRLSTRWLRQIWTARRSPFVRWWGDWTVAHWRQDTFEFPCASVLLHCPVATERNLVTNERNWTIRKIIKPWPLAQSLTVLTGLFPPQITSQTSMASPAPSLPYAETSWLFVSGALKMKKVSTELILLIKNTCEDVSEGFSSCLCEWGELHCRTWLSRLVYSFLRMLRGSTSMN